MFDDPAGRRTAPDFVAGFAARHHLAANALAQAFAPPPGFVATEVVGRPDTAAQRSDADAVPGPKHFSPADRTASPTHGWDPLACETGNNAFLDPLVDAHQAGYAEGFAAATAEMHVHAERDRALIAHLTQGFAQGGHIERGPLAERLRATVLHLVTRLVGEVGVAPDILAARIGAATDCLADAAESAMLRVHPDDVALLDGRVPRNVFAVGDPHVARGSFVLESASTLVEDGPEAWLEQLAHAIDRVPLPRC
jgi:flagellar assembly protein FliH